MSVFLKIKDTFNKALKKGVECDSIYLTDEDYVDFCSDFNKENISEITINNIKLSISKVKDKDNSFLTSSQADIKKIDTVEKKKKSTNKKNFLNNKKIDDKFYLKIK